MKKIHKILPSLILVLGLALSLSACENNKPTEPCTTHIDDDGNGVCDICKSAVKAPAPECTHRDLDDNGKCDDCGESFSELTTPKGLEHYVDMAVQGLETGLFLYIAHPDLMLHSYPGMDDAAVQLSRQLCREANRLNIPLEYNLYGKLKKVVPPALGYPCEAFWEIAAEENVRAAVGIDAHRPRNFEIEDMEAGIQKLESMGITVLRDPTKA